MPGDAKNGTNDWKKWTNHALFTIVMALCTGLIILFMRFSSATQEASASRIIDRIDNLEKTMIKTDSDQSIKLDKVIEKAEVLCSKVQEHETLLRLPFNQRHDFYKFRFGVRDKP
jgi:hypothetical protein